MHTRTERTQNNNGDVIIVDDAEYMNSRIGHCWMKGRLKTGDILLCVAHSGDAFHNWILLDNGISNCIEAHAGSNFGAYGYSQSKVLVNSPAMLDAVKNKKSLRDPAEIKRIKSAIDMIPVDQVMNS